jgi:hypothetical protein
MDDTHTLDALVQFLYRELAAEEVPSTVNNLENVEGLRIAYGELLTAKAQLPKVVFNPSTDTLNRILQYSASTAV